jgi:hypothetical protein
MKKKKKRDSPVMCANCNKPMKKLAKPYKTKTMSIGDIMVTHKCECGCEHATKEMEWFKK